MGEAFLWGLAGAASLLIGAAAGLYFSVPSRVLGLVLAFGAGALISALAFELTEHAYRLGGADVVALGLALGAFAYFGGDVLIERRGGRQRMMHAGGSPDSTGAALLLGAVLDGIPESAVIGITLLEGGGVGVAFLAAVFLSNLPESFAASSGMRRAGHSNRSVLLQWVVVVLVCAVSSALGFALLDGASGNAIGLINAFAGGAVLTMLADTMMPQAFAQGGRPAGLFTVLGFALAFLLSTLN
ncbi:MAG: ZIP family zinc transporter [Actinomycetota bacterium]